MPSSLESVVFYIDFFFNLLLLPRVTQWLIGYRVATQLWTVWKSMEFDFYKFPVSKT